MRNLVIDAGNTQYKMGFFDNNRLIRHEIGLSISGLQGYIDQFQPHHVLFSSVNISFEDFKTSITGEFELMNLSSSLPLPIGMDYDTPHTLGMDRVAAAVGAYDLYPGMDLLVIDMGTCITYDWVSRDGVYQGGIIAPGVQMRFKAMHQFTKRLPLLSPLSDPPVVGKSTAASMQSGVMNGILAEMEGIIGRYRNISASMCVVLCGGDAPYFESSLKDTIFAVPQLVLFGLNRILTYNVD
ncbi:type III pantothenate kinase [Dyadobacter jejuensis]|uniref:Type III pantothenate kinase n=1 Tax=Dyadobacter jejuensis TaxID=1082580 RepID=A0A316AHD4_9BACT|nr:type III pantothenate kinase [Dyadobacter jejuensis]PWJ57113.1 type III pantothenate kinase [Dyadobacter jejuensis]